MIYYKQMKKKGITEETLIKIEESEELYVMGKSY
jgi:hypothetical protein